MDFPKELKYTEEHEWIRIDEGNVAVVGITDYAQDQLGEIVYVEVETLDEDLEKNAVFGTIEAVKTVSDLYLPLQGKVVAFNEKLEDEPSLVNEDPYGEGWIIKVELEDDKALEELLDSEAYENIL